MPPFESLPNLYFIYFLYPKLCQAIAHSVAKHTSDPKGQDLQGVDRYHKSKWRDRRSFIQDTYFIIEMSYVFNEDSQYKNNIVFWKRLMDDVSFVWRGKKKIWSCLTGCWMKYGARSSSNWKQKGYFFSFSGCWHNKMRGEADILSLQETSTHSHVHPLDFNSPKNMMLEFFNGLIPNNQWHSTWRWGFQIWLCA